MKCRECREELFLSAERQSDRDLSEFEIDKLPDKVQVHLEHCSSCAEVYGALRLSLEAESWSLEIPSDLADRVADRILESSDEGDSKIADTARSGRFSRLLATAAAAILLVATSVFLTLQVSEPGGRQEALISQEGGAPASENTIQVHLRLEAPQAERVSVVGDWNGWDPQAQRMHDENGDGVWELKIELDRSGEYQYQFIIDGQKWVPDPNSPLQVDDGFGGVNSILSI
ncbi:MAG TPA: hypothetical protein ENN41_08545 [Sediminispirochaeta sp.]|nr:hypothetical protein [Sediminispirochaeta sp.]